ncbi:MAG: DNA internalization-related competence protein ComEC/Rec2 [Aquabacterium sp.]
MWLTAALAWLVGIAWQTGEPDLQPLAVYQAGVVLALCGLCACWGLRLFVEPQAGRMRVALGVLRCVLGLAAVIVMAWSSTGWRASRSMREHVPLSWLTRHVPVDVQVEGLPQAITGGVMLDARVLAWPGLLAEGLPQPHACCLPTHLSLRLNLSEDAMPWAGQQWRLMVKLHPPDGLSNPGGFDPTLAYFERGVRAVGHAPGRGGAPVLLSAQAQRPWQGVIDRWRQRIRTIIFQHVQDKRAAGVLAGLSVGDQSAIEREDWDVFRRTGVAHLVSISGTHIAMFGWLAAGLARRLWARWPTGVHQWPASDVALWAAVLGSGLYALLAGWGVPAQRTVWMMLIMAVLRTSGRQWPWPLTWLVSAVCITVLDPWALRQVGFWLSYVAVGVLMSSGMVGGPPREADGAHSGHANDVQPASPLHAMVGKLWASFKEMLRTQTMVTVALTPLSLVCFQQTSLVSLLANLFAIPVFTAGITPLAMLGTLWPPCWDAAVWLLQLTMRGLQALSTWPMATTTAASLPMWAAALAVLAGLAQAWSAPWRWRLLALPCALPLLYLPQAMRLVPAPRPGAFQVLAADVGQGTAVLLRTARHTLLFDAGPRIGELNAGDRTLLPLMHTLGVTRIDTLMISHQDTDHVGGAPAIVKGMPVAQLLTSLAEAHPLRHQAGLNGQPVPHQACMAGQQWLWDKVRFDVLHPTPYEYAHRDGDGHNAMSCVLRVSTLGVPGHSVLVTADIEAGQEAAILERSGDALKSDVLIVPHHGSQTSSTRSFLQAVDPMQSVIQVGRRNAYKHPSRPVLARYDAMGLAWQATPDCGAYVWNSDEPMPSAPKLPGPGQGGPQLGHCWRHEHHAYWDRPTPIRPDAPSAGEP